MFNTLKRELRLVEVLEYITGVTYKLTGENTWIPEDDVCPSCDHKNCFRVKDEGINEESFAHCFSESLTWDVISMVATLKEVSNMDAAKLLAKHYNITLPHDYSPLQEVLNLAANYYHELIYSSGPYAELNGLTPLEYQKQVRRHTDESILKFGIGWSDGNLIKYLESVGVSEEIIKESGLASKKGTDFFPSKVFMYPHLVRGRTSHFTFKDTLKQKAFQLPNRYKLNGHSYYNSDSINHPGPVAVCEGENDCISIVEAGWASGVICCNGSISKEQLDWLVTNLKDRDIVTFFDNDPAGNGYREKTDKLRRSFKSLTHACVSGQVKDIDEYLKKGGDLSALLESAKQASQSSSIEVEDNSSEEISPIVIKNGCYHKVVYKDGNESLRQLTNFTMELLNIYIRSAEHSIEREREIRITSQDGAKSKPFIISSDSKTSLKSFKTLIANAIDASFYGTEADLNSVWEKVYSMSTGKVVYLINQVGRIETSDFTGWLFKDCFITDHGSIYEPDNTGVMWIAGSTTGIKPVSLISGGAANISQAGVPSIKSPLTQEERKEFTKNILKTLSDNLGDMGEALTILGWCWATVHSKTIFDKFGFFPHLQFWGTSGKGKSWLIKMFLDIFNMDGIGYSGINGLNSGVAFSRKLAYYTSLPMCIDEIRNDELTGDWYGSFREWYNRSGRAIGTKEGSGIRVFDINSTIIFGGEDQFTDPATRSRCISLRVRKNNREMVRSFKVLEEHRNDMNAIGYEWILGYSSIDKSKLIEEFLIFERFLKKNNVESRQARNWATVGIFANRLCKEYFPEYNYMEFLIKVTAINQEEQREDSTLLQFWRSIEGIQSMERPLITSDHIKREGDDLYIWYAEIYRLFEKDGNHANKQKFSKNAILAALREEEYFKGEARVSMGMAGNTRRCIVLDIPKSNEAIQTIAGFLDK